ncbi:MAG: urate hydroxylase PuuD, partial [bacterium]
SVTGYEFLLRWFHFLSGITWIGILYYFNFIQGAFMGEAEAGTKTDVVTKLMPRALWWFRWGAMGTVATGLLLYINRWSQMGTDLFFNSSYGISITIGGVLGLIMWFNVWFIIWPNQKVIIAANVAAVAKGGAPEGIGTRPRVAFLFSRINTMLSIPMLFFMAAAGHMNWTS